MGTKILLTGLICGLLSTGLMACGGGNYNGQYSGTWSGTLQGQQVSQTVNATMYQSGGSVNGTFIASGGTNNTVPISGTLTGSPSGSTLNSVTLTIPTGETGAGSLTGTLTLSGNSLTGAVAGTTGGSSSSLNLSLTQSQ